MNEDYLSLNCPFKDVEPALISKPYPKIEVEGKNKYYADLLSVDLSGAVSEISAVTQYINHEIRLADDYCDISKLELSIAKVEMMHIQILGSLVVLLGSEFKYNAHYCKKRHPWTSKYVQYKKCPKDMILADIEAEEKAIKQYRYHIRKIDDCYITNMLLRIIMDEEHHLDLLNEALNKLKNK